MTGNTKIRGIRIPDAHFRAAEMVEIALHQREVAQ